jgi:hypothetical protein
MINATAPRSITPEQSLLAQREARLQAVDAIYRPSLPGRSTLHLVADRLRQTGLSLRAAWRLSANPAYFELDRRSRGAVHLGAGLTWESDSFWPSLYPLA